MGIRHFSIISALLLCIVGFAAMCGAESVTLAWDPSSSADVAGYKIHYGPSSRTYTASVDAGNVTQYTLDGLTAGTKYFFAATAYDKWKNESDFSNEIDEVVGPVAPAGNMRIIANSVNINISVGSGGQ
jgi:hypothetical protein